MILLPKGLFDFQADAKAQLLAWAERSDRKESIVIKAPTGAGKTVILIAFIDEYLIAHPNTVFVWLCPGKGNLEEQSRQQMERICPNRKAASLLDSLTQGFEHSTTYFINWELVTKRGNNALKPSERKNIYERIEEGRRNGADYFIIIDEEHSNDTHLAQDLIASFLASHTTRVSATPTSNSNYDYYEIDENEVIAEGIITKAISVNEGIKQGMTTDDSELIKLADEKRKAISEAYQKINKGIRPLVLIQFPSAQPARVVEVEKQLKEMGYSYENGMAAKWLDNDKQNITETLTSNSGGPIFLLMKQAISTGWDCPRAKILVKLREGGSEQFKIQTIGRIRRMPERCHYDNTLLDFCYVYTLDETFTAGLLAEMDKAFISNRLHRKDKCAPFRIMKELRDLEIIQGIAPKDLFSRIYDYFKTAYRLSTDTFTNMMQLKEGGYVFDKQIHRNALQGTFIHAETMIEKAEEHTIAIKEDVNTHRHGIYYMHVFDELKNITGQSADTIREILLRLFCEKRHTQKKFLNLKIPDFYAFIINNQSLLKSDFNNIAADRRAIILIENPPKEIPFSIPEYDFYKYDNEVKDEVIYDSNAFEQYTSGYATAKVRSTCEMLFERYCEDECSTIDWIYKNGDSGQQYFSLVYYTSLGKQRLFYPDYIIRLYDGTTWIIEAKGGENISGGSKNIDKYAEIKFERLKDYVQKHYGSTVIKWGFVRDIDSKLFLCNTTYTEDMSSDNWRPIKEFLE